MLNTIQNTLTKVVEKRLDELGFSTSFAEVEHSSRPELSSFQNNAAFKIAQMAKKRGENLNPREIAAEILDGIKDNPYIGHVSIAGPGFLNIEPSDVLLSGRANELFKDEERSGAIQVTEIDKQKFVLDYGGPNIAKPMHVGHLRSAIIGECLKRVLKFKGHDVIADIHLGDWGYQMGLLIAEIEERNLVTSYFNRNAEPTYEEEIPITIDALSELYPYAAAKAKNDPQFKVKAQRATAELQDGFWGYTALLQHFKKISITELKRQYDNLDVKFDLWKGESDVHYLVKEVISTFKNQGLAKEDEGALIVEVENPNDKKKIPPLILKSSAGSALYGTTDLATILERKNDLQPNKILYVVDQRQSQHFEQVFRAAEKAGWFDITDLEHLGFGTVNGSDGKPFKTREGGVMELAELMTLINTAAEKAYDRIRMKRSFETTAFIERGDIADKVGKAAIKFADLQNPRTSSYVFEIDRFVSFEGKTGPYLQYQAVRANKIITDAKQEGIEFGVVYTFDKIERSLVLALDDFDRSIESTIEKRAPHILCDHLYSIAQEFSKFYKHCPVLANDIDGKIKASRMSICRLFHTQMTVGLDLLGIVVPPKM